LSQRRLDDPPNLLLDQIIQGDCLEVMRSWSPGLVDLMVTDPPYGLSFMGKDWDRAVPRVDVWRECVRVLKPGAFAFIMCTPRQDCLSHMIVNLESAGFNTGFTSLYHCFASGFPKSENISLAVDKRECMKQLTEKLGRKPTREEFNEAWKTFREVIGKTQPFGRENRSWQGVSNKSEYQGGWQVTKQTKEGIDVTEAKTTEAKALDGSYGGFQPKPVVEIIIVAMKPLSERTYVDQALENRKGVTWLDDARVPFERSDIPQDFGHKTQNPQPMDWEKPLTMEKWSPQNGRFPANLLVSDNALNDGTTHTSGKNPPVRTKIVNSTIYGGGKGLEFEPTGKVETFYGDSGSFSRYFDLDKWWEKKLGELPESVQRTFPFLIVAKASKSERNEGLEHLSEKGTSLAYRSIRTNRGAGYEEESKAKNVHPTVKPLKLMSYLITLGSRPNDVVLDPFIGSGTTALAARMLGRRYVGVELNVDYVRIARARLATFQFKRHKGVFRPLFFIMLLRKVYLTIRGISL